MRPRGLLGASEGALQPSRVAGAALCQLALRGGALGWAGSGSAGLAVTMRREPEMRPFR